MEYPADFPEHLKAGVDEVIHKEEVAFIDWRNTFEGDPYGSVEMEEMGIRFILRIFKAFTKQAINAGWEGLWSVERIRGASLNFWTL